MWDLDTIGITQEEDIATGPELPKPIWNKAEERYQMGLTWRSEARPISNYDATRARTSRMKDRLSEEAVASYETQLTDMLASCHRTHTAMRGSSLRNGIKEQVP